MYKGGKFHWVDLLFQENSIKIVIRLTGYFLLRPLMNEPLISENLTSHLGGCVSVYVCRYVCVCMCVCPLPWFFRSFHEERANPKSE